MSELVVLAFIAGRMIAIPAAAVHSVIDIDAIVPVPRAPAHVAGLTALRSRALTVIDTAVVIGAIGGGSALGERAIVVKHAGHDYALLVEAVSDVVATNGSTSPAPSNIGHGWQCVARGLVETDRGPALLVDPAALLAPDSELAA